MFGFGGKNYLNKRGWMNMNRGYMREVIEDNLEKRKMRFERCEMKWGYTETKKRDGS